MGINRQKIQEKALYVRISAITSQIPPDVVVLQDAHVNKNQGVGVGEWAVGSGQWAVGKKEMPSILDHTVMDRAKGFRPR